jgi:hypothetical protein
MSWRHKKGFSNHDTSSIELDRPAEEGAHDDEPDEPERRLCSRHDRQLRHHAPEGRSAAADASPDNDPGVQVPTPLKHFLRR